MAASLEVAGDVAAAGGALAGLILVYLGAVSASFASFDTAQQKAVRSRHQFRAWFGFAGLVLCLASVALALVAKWLAIPCMAVAAVVVLIIALAWVIGAGLMTVLEIR